MCLAPSLSPRAQRLASPCVRSASSSGGEGRSARGGRRPRRLAALLGVVLALSGCSSDAPTGASDEPSFASQCPGSTGKWDGLWSGDILRSGSRLGSVTLLVCNDSVTRIEATWSDYETSERSCPARRGTFSVQIPIFRCRSDYYACTPGGTGAPGSRCCPSPNFFVVNTVQIADMGFGGNGEFVSTTRLEGIVHPQPIGPGLGVCGLYNVPYSATRR